MFAAVVQDIETLAQGNLGASYGIAALENVDKCAKAVDAILAAKIPASYAYPISNSDKKQLTRTVADIKKNVCEAGRKAAKAYTKDFEAAKKAYQARLTKAGLAGDKLQWFKRYDGQVISTRRIRTSTATTSSRCVATSLPAAA